MFKFLSKIGKQKVKNAGQSITEAIVKFDPESATEAAIEMMDERVSELALEAAKMRQEYEREQLEADTIKVTYNQRIDAAQHIETQLAEAKGNKKKELDNSLSVLLDSIDSMRPDVEREIDEASDAKAVLEQIESALEMAADKLKTARGDHKKAQNEMKKAEFKRKNAEAAEERQKKLAGISNDADSLSIALTTMKTVASEDLAKADAANRKSTLLKNDSLTDNAAINDALNAVSGSKPEPASASDRLSTLKKL